MRTILLLLALSACGDDGSSAVDASIDAYDSARCLIDGDYGDLGAKTGTTAQGPQTLTVVLDTGPPRDSFFLKLNAGKGAFAGAPMPGTYPLAGADAASPTCGVCVNIIADIVTGQGPSKFYFATAGSVTLTSVTPPIGTVTNLVFTEVDAGGGVIAGGCSSAIDAMAFSTM